MLLGQRLRRLLFRARRVWAGDAVDHEPIVEVIGRPPSRPLNSRSSSLRATHAKRAPILGATARMVLGFVAAVAVVAAGYGWLSALEARAPEPFAPLSAPTHSSDAVGVALAMLERAASPESEASLIVSRRPEREALARLGAVQAIGAASAALSAKSGAAEASALAPAAALATATSVEPERLKIAADALSRVDFNRADQSAQRAARASLLARAASSQIAQAAAALRATPKGLLLTPPQQQRQIVIVRGMARAWAVMLSAEPRAAAPPSFAPAIGALDAIATFRPALFLSGPMRDHTADFVQRLDAAEAALKALADEETPTALRGLAP